MSSDLIFGLAGASARPAGRHDLPAAGRQIVPRGGHEDTASPGEPAAIDMQALSSVVSAIKDYVQNIQRDLEFTVDKELNRVIIRVYDSETREVIRQIPAEEMLKLARQLARAEEGLLLDLKA